MDKTALLDNGLFQFNIPILKSHQDAETGDVIIDGIASIRSEDEQGETLDPSGFVLNYFEKSGWIKWEHKGPNNGPAAPSQFIGEPLEGRITPEGFYLKARLYGKNPLTHEIAQKLRELEESGSSRKMGFSIEGQALQRDPRNPEKVTKAIIRNVVLTMNPVNTGTFVNLAKSLSSPDSLEVSLDADFSLDKALGTADMSPVVPQSLEGADDDDEDSDEDEEASSAEVFGQFMHRLLDETVHKSLFAASESDFVQYAYDFASNRDLGHDLAEDFAQYMHSQRHLLKSVITDLHTGGGKSAMKFAQMLGTTMQELEKSLQAAPIDEDAALNAVINDLTGQQSQTQQAPVQPYPYQYQQAPAQPYAVQAQAQAQPHQYQQVPVQPYATAPAQPYAAQIPPYQYQQVPAQPYATAPVQQATPYVDLSKSMGSDALEAINVSPFLDDLMKSLNQQFTISEQRNDQLMHGMALMGKALMRSIELTKSLQEQVEEMGATPVGRRSVVTQPNVQTAGRQLPPGTPHAATNQLSKSQVTDMLVAACNERKIPAADVSLYEMSGQLSPLAQQVIGINTQQAGQ